MKLLFIALFLLASVGTAHAATIRVANGFTCESQNDDSSYRCYFSPFSKELFTVTDPRNPDFPAIVKCSADHSGKVECVREGSLVKIPAGSTEFKLYLICHDYDILECQAPSLSDLSSSTCTQRPETANERYRRLYAPQQAYDPTCR